MNTSLWPTLRCRSIYPPLLAQGLSVPLSSFQGVRGPLVCPEWDRAQGSQTVPGGRDNDPLCMEVTTFSLDPTKKSLRVNLWATTRQIKSSSPEDPICSSALRGYKEIRLHTSRLMLSASSGVGWSKRRKHWHSLHKPGIQITKYSSPHPRGEHITLKTEAKQTRKKATWRKQKVCKSKNLKNNHQEFQKQERSVKQQ